MAPRPYFYYVSCEPEFIAPPRRENTRGGEKRRARERGGRENFRSGRKVYRNVVKQLPPTRSIASFVLLQLVVPGRHVSAFRGMFRLGKEKPVTFSISEASPFSVHTSYPPFSKTGIIGSLNWSNTTRTRRDVFQSTSIASRIVSIGLFHSLVLEDRYLYPNHISNTRMRIS